MSREDAASVATSLADLRALIRDLAAGGVVVVEPLDALLGAEAGDPTQAGLRTLAQLDGDLSVTIHRRILESPEFAAIHARHLARVEALVHDRLRRIRRLIAAAGWAAALLAASITAGAWQRTGADAASQGAMTWIAAAVAGGVMAPIGRALLRRALGLR